MYLKVCYTALDTDNYVKGLFFYIAKNNEKNDFCKNLGNSVCLKSGYRKRKGGLKTGCRKSIGVSKVVTEEKEG